MQSLSPTSTTQYPRFKQLSVQGAQNSLKKSSFLITASPYPSHLSYSQVPWSLAFLAHSSRKHQTCAPQHPGHGKIPRASLQQRQKSLLLSILTPHSKITSLPFIQTVTLTSAALSKFPPFSLQPLPVSTLERAGGHFWMRRGRSTDDVINFLLASAISIIYAHLCWWRHSFSSTLKAGFFLARLLPSRGKTVLEIAVSYYCYK